jgi:tetratricopeptide (TPR) repeat protein
MKGGRKTRLTMRLQWPQSVVILLIGLLPVRVLATAEKKHEPSRDEKILQIQQLINNHDLEQASRLLDQIAKQFPADAGFENLRGIVAAQQGDFERAKDNFRRAIEHESRFTAAYLNLGRLYQENSGSDPQARPKALELYQRVLRYDPKNLEANYQSAELLLQGGEYQRSLQLLSRLPENMQRDAQQLSVACADYAGLGDRKHTDTATAQLLGSPDFSEVDAEQMLPALVAGKRDDLIVSLFEALRKRTQLSAQSLRALGLAYDRVGRLTEARATLERFVGDGNLSVSSLLALARVAYEQQDYQGSLGYLAHARELAPMDASVHYFFGLVCLDLNLIAEARNSFEKAVNLEPENPSYNYAMGAASAFRHDPAEAVPYFEKYLKLKPEDPRGRLALGVALFRAKDYDGATPWLMQAAKDPQTATAAHYYLGAIDVQQRRLDKARGELELALQDKPDYADALAELGQCYLVQKDYLRAEQKIQQALKIDPDHISANFYLLNLYIRTGDTRQEAQAKRFDDLQKLRDQKVQEYLRMVEVRPFEGP